MDTQITQLLNEVAISGGLLPPVLMLMPKTLSENIKKLVVFIACVALTLFVSQQNHPIGVGTNWEQLFSHFVVVLVVAQQTYDKAWKPLADTVGNKTGMKFLCRK